VEDHSIIIRERTSTVKRKLIKVNCSDNYGNAGDTFGIKTWHDCSTKL